MTQRERQLLAWVLGALLARLARMLSREEVAGIQELINSLSKPKPGGST